MSKLLIMLIFSTPAMAKVDCNKHKVYCRIVELQPSIKKDFALELSNHIYRKAKKYKTDPMISVAIAMQESSLRNINRVDVGIPEHCTKEKRYLLITNSDNLTFVPHTEDCKSLTKVVTDIGVFQIHIQTAKNFDIDPYRLLGDIEYQVESHMKILTTKLKKCKKYGEYAWSCYHSKTESHRKEYIKRVNKYLKRDQ